MDKSLFFEDQVSNHRTKHYFREVSICMQSGCYRSALVALWSVILFDVLEKLNIAANGLGDEKAKCVLDQVAKIRDKGHESAEWERKIIEYLLSNKIITKDTEVCLCAIQSIRHLCAHPAFDRNYELFSPSRELVYAYVEFSIREILSVDSFGSRGSFDWIISSLAAMKTKLLADPVNGSSLIVDLYFSRLSRGAKIHIFKSMWRLCFRSIDDRCIENRHINCLALKVLYETDRDLFNDQFRKEPKFFSDICFTDELLELICKEWFVSAPSTFTLLTKSVQLNLKYYVESSFQSQWNFPFSNEEFIQQSVLCWSEKCDSADLINVLHSSSSPINLVDIFVQELMMVDSSRLDILQNCLYDVLNTFKFWDRYLDRLIQKLWLVPFSADLLGKLNEEQTRIFIDLASRKYASSNDYNSADNSFERYIKPILSSFSKIDLDNLVQQVENSASSSQCLSRSRCRKDHALVKARYDKLGATFDSNGKFFL